MTAGFFFHVRDLKIAGILMLVGGFAVPLFTGAFPEIICPLRATTGVPCPLCGMTTAVTATVHLDIGAALAANPAGIVAVVAAVVLLFVKRSRLRLPAVVVAGALGGMWLFELARYGFI